MNEKGLMLDYSIFHGYAHIHMKNKIASSTLAPWELGTWILSNFSSIIILQEHIHHDNH